MIFLVPYAYDRMPYGKPREGVPTNRLGTKARCDSLVAIARRSESFNLDYRFILSAGFSKQSPASPSPKVWEGLASQMKRYLLYQHIHPGNIFAKENAWGTYEETMEVLRVISERCTEEARVSACFSKSPEIWISTNLGHMPRVWLCCHFLQKKMVATHIRRAHFHFVIAPHSFTLKEYFQETAKFFQYLYRFLFRKW